MALRIGGSRSIQAPASNPRARSEGMTFADTMAIRIPIQQPSIPAS
jgi:hypothetical protein